MRINRLDLIAVGPFTDVELDFSAGACGLHIVFGPNEAGKSSSLRALHALLYDFHPRTSDNFIHDYKKLRVGGLFQAADGSLLHCVRHKGNKNTLRDGHSEEPIEERALSSMLASVNEDQFRQRFGLDHDQLRAGCESLRAGEGDLAEALFSAGAGLGDVHRVIETVREEAAEIYKPSGRKQQIPQALEKYNTAEEVVREAVQLAPQWKQREEHLNKLRTDLQQLEGEIGQCSARLEQLERIRIALPQIYKRQHLLDSLNALQQVPLLDEKFAERRISAMTQLEEATRTREQLQQSIASTKAQLESMATEAPELAREAEISQLQESLGASREGQGDRPGLVTTLDQLDAQSRHALHELGHGELSFDEAQKLQLDKLTREHIQKLTTQHTLLENQRAQRSEHVAELAAELERLESETVTAEPPATDELAELVQQIRSAGDLESQLTECTAANSSAATELVNRLKRFTPWQGDLDQLAQTATPSEETIRRHEGELEEAAERKDSAAEKLQQAEESLEVLRGEIESLSRQHDVPTEHDLTESRNQREQSWQGIRSRWLQETPPSEADLPADDLELAHQFESQSAEADTLSDRLRHEAEQVAQKADKLTQQEKLIGQQERLGMQLAEAEQALADQQALWQQAWSKVGLEPLSPREMLSWSVERESILSAAEAHAREVARQQRLEQQIASEQDRLAAALQTLKANDAGKYKSLAALLRHADALIKRLESERRQHEATRRDLQKTSASHKKNVQKLEELTAECHQAGKAWRKALAQFDIPEAATAAEASSLLETLDEFFRLRRQATDKRGRIEGIDKRVEQFATDAKELAQQIDGELVSLEAAEIAKHLQQRLTEAKAQSIRRTGHEDQLTKGQQQLEVVSEKIRRQEAALHTLCQEAACDRVEQLAAVEQESRKRRETEHELSQIETHLASLTQGMKLAEFIDAASKEDADQLPAEVDRLQVTQKNMSTQRDQLLQQINTLAKELDTATGGDRAALAAETVKAELANLSVLAEDYARLKLAESVLLRAMQRYREQNQGPILQRASEYFALLTLGSFSRLEPHWNENGEAVLVGVRADGETKVLIDGMSSGSTDQLYLALRLASLEHHLKQSPPLPLVVDDILIHFDNARSAAALKALAEVSKHTQVIMFTHHRHLVELARETLDEETLFVQELTSPLVSKKQ